LVAKKGYQSTDFCVSTINNVLNRLEYTLKKVRKSLPLKRLSVTDSIFENIAKHRNQKTKGVLKISLDVKDKVRVGALSRKGYHRGKDHVDALDKDQHWDGVLAPLGILEIESAQSTVILGNSRETSDFIVDGIEMWYQNRKVDLADVQTLEIYLDNGPSVGGKRTQFINRMIKFVNDSKLNVHLLYYPPYHSKYNPIERVWAAVEQYWNGTLLNSVNKVINTIGNVKWKGVKIQSLFIDKVYEKGIKLTSKEMKEKEFFLERNPALPKWDILIKPSQ
jgi:hypothetical protein